MSHLDPNSNAVPEVIEFILEKNINIYDKIENSYKNNKKWIVSCAFSCYTTSIIM